MASRIADAEPPGLTAGGDGHPPDIADDLPDMLRRGRLSGGTAVSRVTFQLVDGRQVVLDLPVPMGVAEADQPADPLTDMEAAVLEVVADMRVGTVLSTDAIASKSGYAASGKLRDFVQSLAKSGRLKRVRNGYERIC